MCLLKLDRVGLEYRSGLNPTNQSHNPCSDCPALGDLPRRHFQNNILHTTNNFIFSWLPFSIVCMLSEVADLYTTSGKIRMTIKV